MEELQIPDKFKPGFKLLVTVESKTVEKLMAALSQASPSLRIEDLASALASQVEVLTVEEVADILGALISLYNFRDYSGASIDQLTVLSKQVEPTTFELMQIAQTGGAFNFLEDEPDLYTLEDGEPYSLISK